MLVDLLVDFVKISFYLVCVFLFEKRIKFKNVFLGKTGQGFLNDGFK